MRKLICVSLLLFSSISRAGCETSFNTVTPAVAAPSRSTFSPIVKYLRNFATGLAALGLVSATDVPAAQAADFMTINDVRQSLTSLYGYSPADADRVVRAIQKYDPENKLPISGVISTSGLSFSLILGTGTWPNLSTSFKDDRSAQVVQSNCLFDMTYYNGGLAAHLGYKWVVMILLGETKVSELAGATYGRGLGLTFDPVIGVDLQYLPSNNRASSMVVISPQIGVGGGLRFPKIEFHPAQSCD